MSHFELEQQAWADEIEKDEEQERSLCEAPTILSEEEYELSLWGSLY